jgi:hypothetical protein
MYDNTEAWGVCEPKEARPEVVDDRLGRAESIVKQFERIKKSATWTPSGWNGWSLYAEHALLDRSSVTLYGQTESALGLRRKFTLLFKVRPSRIRPYCAVLLRSLRRLDDLSPHLRELARLPDPDVPRWAIEQMEVFLTDTRVGSYGHALSTIAEMRDAVR